MRQCHRPPRAIQPPEHAPLASVDALGDGGSSFAYGFQGLQATSYIIQVVSRRLQDSFDGSPSPPTCRATVYHRQINTSAFMEDTIMDTIDDQDDTLFDDRLKLQREIIRTSLTRLPTMSG